jgi:PAS domain S-box-containing protein
MNKGKEATVGTRKANRRGRRIGPNGVRPNGGRDGTRSARFTRPDELEAAIQRYSDLYEFAPVGYVTLDRAGRIEQANLAACELFEATRELLIGTPFSICVAREHLDLFLHHLARCRLGERRVETNLFLKKRGGGNLSALLSSTSTRVIHNGSQVFQTAIVDLTEREQAVEALRAKEAELEQIVTQTPFMLTRCTRDLRYRYVSDAYAKMVGQTQEELAGKPIVEIMGKEGLAAIRSKIDRVLAGEIVSYEALVPFKNKEPRFLHGVYVPDKSARGNIVGWIASIIDITERKRMETAARRLAAVVQSSHDAIVAKDLNGIITDWNQSAQRIFGYKAKEITGKSILTLIPKDRQSEEKEILRKIRRGESIDHYETIRRRKDGRLINVSLTISPIKDGDGKIIGVSKIARDISKQKEAEKRIAEQARLLDLTSEAILVRDREDRIVYWNHGASELYGYSQKEALGQVTHKLLRTEHPNQLQQIYHELERNNRWTGELVHQRKDGTKIFVMSNWVLDRDESGKRAFVLESNTDITARKKAELSLQRSKDMLESVVQQRTRALRDANRELQSEITRRKGLEGQILEISDREQERLGQELHDGVCQQLTAIAFMARAAAMRLQDHRVADPAELEKIGRLINNSVMDARTIARDLHKEQIDAAVFEQALRDLAERKIWKTPCQFRWDNQIIIEDDRVASEIFRILREGVINANKHAQASEIVLEGCRKNRELVFSVTDNGIGLNGQTKHRGLGFHIMQYRAQSISARLELNSRRRGGTRVAVYLPIKQ